MPLPEHDVERLRDYCQAKVPDHARLLYAQRTGRWTLYARDRNQRFHQYPFIEPAADVNALIAEIERDPTCIFWG